MKLLVSRKWLCFIMAFASIQYSYSQQGIVWNSLQLPLEVSSKWQVPLDVTYRTIGLSSAAFQYTFRAGIRHIFNDRWQAAAGGAIFFTRTSFEKSNHVFAEERRIWQELLAEHKIGNNFSLQNRIRIEQRFFEATSSIDDYVAHRFRYRLAAIKILNNKWRLLIGDEYMHQYDRSGFHFQQNRLSGSVSYLFNRTTYLQAGYIWSALKGPDQHIAILTFQKLIRLHGSRNDNK